MVTQTSIQTLPEISPSQISELITGEFFKKKKAILKIYF